MPWQGKKCSLLPREMGVAGQKLQPSPSGDVRGRAKTTAFSLGVRPGAFPARPLLYCSKNAGLFPRGVCHGRAKTAAFSLGVRPGAFSALTPVVIPSRVLQSQLNLSPHTHQINIRMIHLHHFIIIRVFLLQSFTCFMQIK